MARRRTRSGSSNGGGKLRKSVFCPECETMMKYVKTKPHQWDRDYKGELIRVSLVFYGCGKCQTVVFFKYREDGKPGDLYRKMKIMKDAGIKAQGFDGKMGEILDI